MPVLISRLSLGSPLKKMTLWQGRAQQQMQLSLRSEKGTEWMLLQSPVQREQLRKEGERDKMQAYEVNAGGSAGSFDYFTRPPSKELDTFLLSP
ncbi:hypothetical protein HHUSO_G404 [Huso huso]|uniref:Uncharacterized protein n=1 Tax=Huso huso TaxID=61971 RepID=A0ABR1AA64_HUSHU